MTSNGAGFTGSQDDSHGISLLNLVQNRTLDLRMAAIFWLLAERKASVIVAAPPRLAGKSTVLNAMLQMAPSRYQVVTARGVEEDFSFLGRTEPKSTYILVPEISDHLPMYLWGDKVRKVFEAMKEGYSLAATMHSDSPEDIAAQLASEEVGVTEDLLSGLHVVVNLYMGERNMRPIRRVWKVSTVSRSNGNGNGATPISFWTVARWDSLRDALVYADGNDVWNGLAKRLGMASNHMEEYTLSKQKVLDGWLDRGLTSVDQMKGAVNSYYDRRKT